jgi:hypothetical protein
VRIGKIVGILGLVVMGTDGEARAEGAGMDRYRSPLYEEREEADELGRVRRESKELQRARENAEELGKARVCADMMKGTRWREWEAEIAGRTEKNFCRGR